MLDQSSDGNSDITTEDYGNVVLLYAKLVAQVLSTIMSAFVGTRHLLQVLALRKEVLARRQLQTPILALAGNSDGSIPTPPSLLIVTNGVPTTTSQPSGHTSGTDDSRRNRQASLLFHERENALYAPIGGLDFMTNEHDDDRPRVSAASRILRVMCITDFVFSLSGLVVTAVELWKPSAGGSFQLLFWAQAPHWCSQIASFCWVATLALYIAKHRNRASFDVAIAHAIIWMVVVFYWILELYSSYYKTKGFVHAAIIIWKVMAVGCFLITTISWLHFAIRWRKQERHKGAYVVSKLASYTMAFFIFVGPIVLTDLVLGLHSSGLVIETCSVILAMWPFANAIICIAKPTLCLRIFQANSSRKHPLGQYDSADGEYGSRRFISAINGNPGALNGGRPSGESGRKLLMSPSHHELKGLEIGDKIGEGVAVVYLGKWRGANVAVKMKAVLAALESAADLEEFQHACNVEIQAEAEVMRGLCHPNIVLFMEAGFYRGSICIISEYCARGSLRDVLKQHTPDVKNLNWPTKLRLALGISHGIQYLHNANPPMIHRDLKSPNVLVDDSWHAKIADFDPQERPTIQQVIQSLQRIGREEVWDPTGPRFTGVSQLGVSMYSTMSQSISSSYHDSPTNAGPIGRNFSRPPAALDENHSASDSDSEAFAEEFSYVPTLESSTTSPVILGDSDSGMKKSKRSSLSSRHGSMDSSTCNRLSGVSTTSSTSSMGANDSGYYGSSSTGYDLHASFLSASSLQSSTSSSISNRSTKSVRASKMKNMRSEWRHHTGTIQETQSSDLNDAPLAFVESSPNGTSFIVNI
ncbi:hypothetical protein CCR75_003253 [Bremia lactucae]|uniref:Protein kinase domain-containing protein n=1 Tax=Bremia lactucae TaxID=4779 RepID=A0A976FK38_BRELC|nr:hypothetical protein CCR75_003253 [Bremia lactucae]